MTIIEGTMHVIAVQDLKRSAQFYENMLGFQVKEIGDPGWLMFTRGACEIMAGACPDCMSAGELGDHSYILYLKVNGIDQFYSEVVEKGGEVLKTLRNEPWVMREFALRTIDGHRLMIGEQIE